MGRLEGSKGDYLVRALPEMTKRGMATVDPDERYPLPCEYGHRRYFALSTGTLLLMSDALATTLTVGIRDVWAKRGKSNVGAIGIYSAVLARALSPASPGGSTLSAFDDDRAGRLSTKMVHTCVFGFSWCTDS